MEKLKFNKETIADLDLPDVKMARVLGGCSNTSYTLCYECTKKAIPSCQGQTTE